MGGWLVRAELHLFVYLRTHHAMFLRDCVTVLRIRQGKLHISYERKCAIDNNQRIRQEKLHISYEGKCADNND